MAYNSRVTGPLKPEERDVQMVLARYSTDAAAHRDWVPFIALWRLYLGWWGQYEYREDRDHPRLTRKQFGYAVRRVFPEARRSKRAVARRQRQWGYAFLIGPYSVVTPAPRRPKVSAA